MASTATITEYLEGLSFPASKQDILDYVEERYAPPNVMDTLFNMPEPPDGKYYSMASVWDAAGKVA